MTEFKAFTLAEVDALGKFDAIVPRGLPIRETERILWCLRKLAEARPALLYGANIVAMGKFPDERIVNMLRELAGEVRK